MNELNSDPHGDTGEVFDTSAKLPTGRVCIEASAGTGKTFTLAALAVRSLAETDVPAAGLLIVTFTRAATAELRGRIRDAINEAITHLEAAIAALDTDQPAPQTDVAHLSAIAKGTLRELVERSRRLRVALTEYDTITITTIHAFAQQTLASLGVSSGTDPLVISEADSNDAVIDACADVVARAIGEGHNPAMMPTLSKLADWTKLALRSSDLILEPALTDTDADDADQMRTRLVTEAVALLARRRHDRGLASFDDVLVALRDALRHATHAPERSAIIDTLRSRYRIALIDEFQDTDPVQWEIFETIFDGDESTLVLVGDPKQAIYSFRGADIATYSRAITAPATRRTRLRTNWRADGIVIDALDELLRGATFGDGIDFVHVDPAEHNMSRSARRSDGATLSPVRIRLAINDDIERTGKTGTTQTDAVRLAIANDLVAQVHDALDHLVIPDRDGDRAVQPDDLAVLVSTKAEAVAMQQALVASGVPAVLSRAEDVLESPSAIQWRWLLDALTRPSDPMRTRRFVLGWFSQRDITDLTADPDAVLDEAAERLATWNEVLRDRGVAEFVRRIFDDSRVLERVLAGAEGDRAATDLQHLGELFQTQSTQRPGVNELLALLDPSGLDTEHGEVGVASRRVETQQPSVQIMTVWVAKGLEYPVVFVPTLYSTPTKVDAICTKPDGTRRLGLSEDLRKRYSADARLHRDTERLRLLYVAMTRGRHHCVLWWSPVHQNSRAPITRLLFARDAAGDVDPEKFSGKDAPKSPTEASAALSALAPLIERTAGLVAFECHGDPGVARPRADTARSEADRDKLTAAVLTREVPRVTGRWSFSAITALDHNRLNPDDPSLGDHGSDDEDQGESAGADVSTPAGDAAGRAVGPAEVATASTTVTMPFGRLPAGPRFGTLVHSLFERCDFAADDPAVEVAGVLTDELAWQPIDLTPRSLVSATHADGIELLVDGMVRAFDTPLGDLFGGRRLGDFRRADRLDELSFELLVRPASTPLSDRDIGALIASHLADDHPLAPWAAGLAEGRFGVDLAGHLTGSIDAIFRIESAEGSRFVVSDYKTNRLGAFDAEPDPFDYLGTNLDRAMTQHHYPLQALLYSVALHRYLRSRLAGYDPDLHLGGIAYLFVRAMIGPNTPVVSGATAGIWTWRPSSALITELSDLLHDDVASAGGTR